MRNALLVAGREYAENAHTKGFWIGIFVFPLVIVGSILIQERLAKSTPTRHFVLVDGSGQFDEAIVQGLDAVHQRDVLKAFGRYVSTNLATTAQRPTAADLERMPALDPDEAIERYAENDPESVDLFFEAGGLTAALDQVRPLLAPDAPDFQEPKHRFVRVPLPVELSPDADVDVVASALRPYLRGDRSIAVEEESADLFAAILIPADIERHLVGPGAPPASADDPNGGIQYWSANLADQELREEVEKIVDQEIRRRAYVEEGMDVSKVRTIERTHVPVASLNPKKEVGEEIVSMADKIRQWAPVGFVYLLWIAIFTISQMLLNNTIEEKSNRIIEVLLSSVTPRELMAGKLIGIAGIGLTMITTWLLSGIGILLLRRGPEMEGLGQLLGVLQTSGLLPAFLAYFLLGYLLYSGIFLAIGSVCNTLKEAQNMMGPIMLIMVIPLFTMMFIPKDPNGTLATILSWIPIYTPFVMMNRAAADPPLFDLIGTSIVLVVFTAGTIFLTGRIFRVGILRTGQPPKLLELLRWVRG